MPSSAVSVAIGGTAVVCCVHNRVKREVDAMAFDAATTSIHLCSCCENVFLDPSDTPMFCPLCRGEYVYKPGGPLPEPIGRI